MDRQDIIARLREHEAARRRRGIRHAALFGSCARGEARPDSDVDIMIEVDPAARIGVYEYVAIKDYIAALFDTHVGVVRRDRLNPHVRPAAAQDDPVAREHFLSKQGDIDSGMFRLGSPPKKDKSGLVGDLGSAIESMKRVPWTVLSDLKGDAEILKEIDDAEALLKSLRKALEP